MTNPLRPTITAALAGDSAHPTSKDAVLSERQLVWVKRAVKIMSVVLIAGLALLVGRIVYLVRRAPPQAVTTGIALPADDLGRPAAGTALPAAGTALSAAGPPLADIALPLPADAHVRTISVAGNRLAVHYVRDSGAEAIDIVDLATGRVVSHVAIAVQKGGKTP